MKNFDDLFEKHPMWCKVISILFLMAAWISACLTFGLSKHMHLLSSPTAFTWGDVDAFVGMFVFATALTAPMLYVPKGSKFCRWLFGVSAIINFSVVAIGLADFFNWTALIEIHNFMSVSFDQGSASGLVGFISFLSMVGLWSKPEPEQHRMRGIFTFENLRTGQKTTCDWTREGADKSEIERLREESEKKWLFEKKCRHWEVVLWVLVISMLIVVHIKMGSESSWIYWTASFVFFLDAIMMSLVSRKGFSTKLFGMSLGIASFVEIAYSIGWISIPTMKFSIFGCLIQGFTIVEVVIALSCIMTVWHGLRRGCGLV